MYLIFLLCLNWLISISYVFFVFYYIIFCLINFLSYLILISFNFNYFYFYLNINNFLYSYCLLNWIYISIVLILSCHIFYPYFFYIYNFFIYYYNSANSSFDIISLLLAFWLLLFVFVAGIFLLFFCFYFIPLAFWANLLYNYRIFCFFITYLSWQFT